MLRRIRTGREKKQREKGRQRKGKKQPEVKRRPKEVGGKLGLCGSPGADPSIISLPKKSHRKVQNTKEGVRHFHWGWSETPPRKTSAILLKYMASD